jgi:hypothetical protein
MSAVVSPTRVFVFPCGSEVALEVHHALSQSAHVALVGGSSVESSHGAYLFREHVGGLPHVDEEGFVPALADAVRSARADLVIPAHDSVVLELARRAPELPVPVVGSPAEACTVVRSKRATYELLGPHLRVPRLLDPAGPLELPVFLKPDVGQGSKGVFLARTQDEVLFHLARDRSLLCLEYLPGREYTVDCFSDRHGRLRFAGARERLRISNGIAVDTTPVLGDVFEELARKIQRLLPMRGAWFFQLKRAADGELALLEIGARVAGSMALYRNLGVNFALLAVYDALGRDVEIAPEPRPLRMDRALFSRFRSVLEYRHVYVDLDDTLVRGGRVDPMLVAFLYQCRNDGIALHLVTRHASDPAETLSRHRLSELFDTVEHLPDQARCKSEVIRERPAIFIDDSFAERRRVHERTGIPTFAPDAVESLLDWRA